MNQKTKTNKIFGKTQDHLCEYNESIKLTPDTFKHFKELQTKALTDSINLEIISGFRSFERQMTIWNNKATGVRPIYDKNDNLVDISKLSSEEIMHAILTWSALPGASRHHWGTEIDVYDSSKIIKEQLQLIPSEYENGGPCEKLSIWITQKINSGECKFHLPYLEDLGGVSREPWHLSFTPESTILIDQLDIDELRRTLLGAPIELKEEVLNNLDYIYKNYILNVSKP